MNARKSLVIVANNVAGAALGIVSLYLIGQYLPPSAFGMLGFGLGVVGLAGALVNLGFGQAHIKRVSEGLDLAACNGTFFRIRAGLALTSTALLLAATWAWHHFRGFHDSTTWPILLVLIGYFLLQQTRNTFTFSFQALRRTAKAETLQLVENIARLVLTAAAVLLYAGATGKGGPLGDWPTRIAGPLTGSQDWTAADAGLLLAAAHLGAMAVSALAGAAIFLRHKYPLGAWDRDLARRYLHFAAPLALLAAFTLVAKQMDAIMIGYFWNAGDVGLYYAASRISTLFAMLPLAVGTLFFPMMSELAARREQEAVTAIAVTTQRLLSLVLFGMLLAVVLQPRAILHLMGDRYLDAAPILVLLAVHAILLGFTTVSSGIVRGFDRPRAVARIGLVSVTLNVGLNTLLIPDSLLGVPLAGLKGVGAAAATVVAQGFTLLALYWVSRRTIGHGHIGTPTLKHAVAAAVAGLATYAFMAGILPDGADRVWEVAGVAALALGLYAGGLVALRELQRKDVLFFLDLVHPGRMKDYLAEELGLRRT